MAEFREPMPTITGPGTYLIALIFIALIATSKQTSAFALKLENAAVLVAISLPLSLLITQVYHACFTKFGYKKKNKYWDNRYSKYKKEMYKLDTMVDYLSWQNCKGEKEWFVIQKRASTYHLFSVLLWSSCLFFLAYTIFLLANKFYSFWLCAGFFWDIDIYCWGVCLTYFITVVCLLSFLCARKKIWDVWMVLDRKIIKNIESDLDDWLEDEP